MSAVSFLHSSFLQAVSDVMLWPVHIQNVPQASERICFSEMQTKCDICCACQSICSFIPCDRAVCVDQDVMWLTAGFYNYIEGSRPEWCISGMIYSRNTPFWSGILDMYFCIVLILFVCLFVFPAGHSRPCAPRFSDSLVVGLDLCETVHMLN